VTDFSLKRSSAATLRGLVLGLSAAALMPVVALAQGAGTVSSFTEAQADRGEDAYMAECSGCHGDTLGGAAETPTLLGSGFRNRFATGSPATLFGYISAAMPQQAPGSLTPETYADITAYILSRNRVPAGETELPPDLEALSAITLPPVAQ
jgi:mono/diheme cytochrome c family protein